MLAIYKLYYQTNATVGTHSGYCSGNECEDVDEELFEDVDIVLSKNNSKFFNYLMQRSTVKRLEELLNLSQYFEVDEALSRKTSCLGSGYCDVSPSGLRHEYSINSCELKRVEFCHYVLDGEFIEIVENDILKTNLNNLRNKIYSILYCLKAFKIVKDMRVLIISKFLQINLERKNKIETYQKLCFN